MASGQIRPARSGAAAVDWTARLGGMVALGLAAYFALPHSGQAGLRNPLPWRLALSLVAAFIGFTVAPFLTTRPLRTALDSFSAMPASTLVMGVAGMVVGLVVATLISVPLFRMRGWIGWGVPLMLDGALGAAGLTLGLQRRRDLDGAFARGAGHDGSGRGADGASPGSSRVLVDTSAIIDGRIADVAQTGFLTGCLVIPRFVLDELRHIADSSDPLRRNRGRRGLEVLNRLRKDAVVPLEVLDAELVNGQEVDATLVRIAREQGTPILTTDFNLNRVAELQGVHVLNVNELASALKPVVLPGEEMQVQIVQEGKEAGQGVGFLDDGTMVVVEGGRRYINARLDVTVTRVLQTAAGRIIFATPRAGG